MLSISLSGGSGRDRMAPQPSSTIGSCRPIPAGRARTLFDVVAAVVGGSVAFPFMVCRGAMNRELFFLVSLGAAVIIVVVALIGPRPMCSDPMNHPRESQAVVRLVSGAVQKFQEANGRFPNVLSELVPNYIARIPLDAWGNELQYLKDAAPDAMVYSIGQDGRRGGVGVDANIYVNSNVGIGVGAVGRGAVGRGFACWK